MNNWQPMNTAPRDGTLVLLLIAPDCPVDARLNPLEDTAGPSRTIGHNNYDNDGENLWQFAGWSWCHDHYTEGKGTPLAWQPLPGLAVPGVDLIAAERARQVAKEGWNAAHDDDHDNGSLAGAAAAYALVAREQALGDTGPFGMPDCWSWDREWWKPKDQLRNLVRAGALIAAELDRLQRASPVASASQEPKA